MTVESSSPSILWIATAISLAVTCTSLLYVYRKSRLTKTKARIDWDSFLFKVLVVTSSFASIFSIGTGVQFLNPTAGIDQFFVIFVLVMLVRYSVLDLKHKLDDFFIRVETSETTPPVTGGVRTIEQFPWHRDTYMTTVGNFIEGVDALRNGQLDDEVMRERIVTLRAGTALFRDMYGSYFDPGLSIQLKTLSEDLKSLSTNRVNSRYLTKTYALAKAVHSYLESAGRT